MANGESISKEHLSHYEKLAADVDGLSQDEAHWLDMNPAGKQPEEHQELNEPIGGIKICTAIRSMARNKCGGSNGIPIEFGKELVKVESGMQCHAELVEMFLTILMIMEQGTTGCLIG